MTLNYMYMLTEPNGIILNVAIYTRALDSVERAMQQIL